MKITSRQCRSARGLLKWNVNDLASRTRLTVKRLDGFERGGLQLHPPENDELVDTFKKEGIIFKDNFDVELAPEQARKVNGQPAKRVIAVQGHGEVIHITPDYLDTTRSLAEDEKPGAEPEKKR